MGLGVEEILFSEDVVANEGRRDCWSVEHSHRFRKQQWIIPCIRRLFNCVSPFNGQFCQFCKEVLTCILILFNGQCSTKELSHFWHAISRSREAAPLDKDLKSHSGLDCSRNLSLHAVEAPLACNLPSQSHAVDPPVAWSGPPNRMLSTPPSHAVGSPFSLSRPPRSLHLTFLRVRSRIKWNCSKRFKLWNHASLHAVDESSRAVLHSSRTIGNFLHAVETAMERLQRSIFQYHVFSRAVDWNLRIER